MSQAPPLVDRDAFREFKKYKAAGVSRQCTARGCRYVPQCVIAIQKHDGTLLIASACIAHFDTFERVFAETREAEGT